MQKSRKLETKVTFALLIAVTLIIVVMLIYIMSSMVTPPEHVKPKISWEIIDGDERYTVRITEAKEGSTPLGIDELAVSILNDTQCLLSEKVIVLLDNTSSNLTFYDKDDDGKLSKSDEFVIRGNLANKGRKFRIMSTIHGEELKIIYFR